MKKKINFLLLTSVLLAVVLTCLSACSVGHGIGANELNMKLSEDGSYYIVTGGQNIAGVMVIPETHEGKPVKEIAARAFSDKWALKTVWGIGYKFELYN